MTLLELINNIFPIAIKLLVVWVIARSIVEIVEIERGNKSNDED